MRSNDYQAVAFFVVAHPDDWQLFMNPNASIDLAAAHNKVVFVHLTAGDAGREPAYWRAREQGAIASVRYRLSALGRFDETWGETIHAGRPITVWSSRNAICHFLRLSDGGLDGSGFESRRWQSLLKLRQGRSVLSAVDGSANYDSWRDLLAALGSILRAESVGIGSKCVNIPDPNHERNAGDHSDHYHSGLAIEELPEIGLFRRYVFRGYHLRYSLDRLEDEELFWKIGMFAAYDKAVHDACGHSTFAEIGAPITAWCLRPAQHREA
jgi:hypothetical protein